MNKGGFTPSGNPLKIKKALGRIKIYANRLNYTTHETNEAFYVDNEIILKEDLIKKERLEQFIAKIILKKFANIFKYSFNEKNNRLYIQNKEIPLLSVKEAIIFITTEIN